MPSPTKEDIYLRYILLRYFVAQFTCHTITIRNALHAVQRTASSFIQIDDQNIPNGESVSHQKELNKMITIYTHALKCNKEVNQDMPSMLALIRPCTSHYFTSVLLKHRKGLSELMEPPSMVQHNSAVDELTSKRMNHVSNVVNQHMTKEHLKHLARKAETLRLQLYDRIDSIGQEILTTKLETIGDQSRSRYLKQLAEQLCLELDAGKRELNRLKSMGSSVSSLEENIRAKLGLVEHIRPRTRSLISQLPTAIQQVAHQRYELSQKVNSVCQVLDQLVSSDPMNNCVNLLSTTTGNLKIDSPAGGLTLISLHGTSFYDTLCSHLDLHSGCLTPDIVLEQLLRLLVGCSVNSTMREHLSDTLTVLEEKCKAINFLQKRDAHIQEKVHQHVKTYTQQLDKTTREIKSKIQECNRFVADWRQIALTQKE